MKPKPKSPTKLSDLLAIPRSETLDCSHHSLTRVPSCTNPLIKKLTLHNNKLQDLIGIETYQQLRELDISHNNIKNWRELKRVAKSLQVLVVEGNPLQTQINHLYNIILYFPSIKKVNRLLMNDQLRKNTIQYQNIISSKILHWMIQLNRMDQRLTRTFCSPQLKIQNQKDRQQVNEILQNQKKFLTSQLNPIQKFKNQSMFIKTRMLKQLLQKQQYISFSQSQKQAVQQNYFQYLISLITRTNKNIAQFLVSQITIHDQSAQKQLLNNQTLMFKEMFYHFKRIWSEQFCPTTRELLCEVQSSEETFPYYPFDEIYVFSVYQSFVDILESNIKKVQQSIERVSKCQLTEIPERKSIITTKYIGDGLYPSTWISDHSLRPLRLSQIDKTESYCDYSDYVPLCHSIFHALESKIKRQSFERVKKHTSTMKIRQNIDQFVIRFEMILFRNVQFGLNKMLQYNHQSKIIETHYRNRKLKLATFLYLKCLVYKKYLRLQKLQELISKKQRATQMIKAYSFKRWKLLSSKTLRYIKEVRKSLDKKNEDLDSRYKRIVQQKLNKKRTQSVYYRKN